MTRYRNKNGASGVTHYQVQPDRIVVRFVNGSTYTYSVGRAGLTHVTKMKELAAAGEGLATYISRYVHHLND